MFEAIKNIFFKKNTKSEKIEGILNKLSSLNGDTEQVKDFENICQEIGKIKAGDIFYTNIIDTLKKFICKNPRLVDTDFCQNIFSEIIPEFKDFRNHNVDYFDNLTHIEKQRITQKLKDLITSKPSNINEVKFSDKQLFKKAQALMSQKKSISSTSDDSSNIEFKDLFLIYSLSNSKEKFDTAILAQLISDTDCWNSLIGEVKKNKIEDTIKSNNIRILSFVNPSDIENLTRVGQSVSSGQEDRHVQRDIVNGSSENNIVNHATNEVATDTINIENRPTVVLTSIIPQIIGAPQDPNNLVSAEYVTTLIIFRHPVGLG